MTQAGRDLHIAGSTKAPSPTRPTVSLIIVAYNGRRYLPDCLASVLAEGYPGCEIILLDNASTDGSAALMERNYPGLTLVRNPHNRGFAAACNQGAALASGDILVFLNQDTRVAPGWLEALVTGLDQGDAVGLATSKVLLMSQPDRIHLCGQEVHYTGLVFGRGFLSPAEEMAEPKEVAAVSGASFAVRRELWEALGGFDETLYMYYEEADLSWRAQLAGYRCLYVPASVVYHDYRPGNTSPMRLYYSMRNRRIMLLKNWRWATLLLLFPGILLAEMVEIALAVRHGWAGVQARLKADLWIIMNARRLYSLHKQAQEDRVVPDGEILRRRASRLTPMEIWLSPVGDLTVALFNLLFRTHYRVTGFLCRVLGL